MGRRPIPERRERWQSRALMAVVGTLLGMLGVYVLLISGAILDFRASVVVAVTMSLTFGGVVWALRAATMWAAVWGSVICLLILMTTGGGARAPLRSGLGPLILLFVLTFSATRLGRLRKAKLGLAEQKRGRDAAQVLANLGMAGLVAAGSFSGIFDGFGREDAAVGFSVAALPVLLLAVLCEATADTVSSEIGQAYGGTPVMLTTWRKMRVGTNGAITARGTAAGVLAAALVAGAGMWGMRMSLGQAMIGLFAGVAGLFFDSLLGATVERKGWLGNDLVNFCSTVFAVMVGLGVLVAMRQ